MNMAQGWELARKWYADRLDPNWQSKTAEEARAVFAGSLSRTSIASAAADERTLVWPATTALALRRKSHLPTAGTEGNRRRRRPRETSCWSNSLLTVSHRPSISGTYRETAHTVAA